MSAAVATGRAQQVTLWLDGAGWTGWTEVSIERGIDTVAGGFTLAVTDRETTGGPVLPISAGMTCAVTLNDQTLITGYVDSVQHMLEAESRTLSLRGRDRAGDLVDCSAMNAPGSWRGQKLEAIARQIAAPFGIEITVGTDTGRAFDRFALQPGETAWAAIERMMRYRGVIAWSQGDGTIFIGNPETGALTGQLVQGVNVIDAESEDDRSARFSTYVVKGQASGNDNRNGRATAQVVGRSADPEITRYRPMLIVAEEQADTASLRRRAGWEAQTRAARGRRLSVTTPGWIAGNGAAWQPGARAQCTIPACNIDAMLLVERVTLQRDGNTGTIAKLDLAPPAAWAQLAEPEPEQ